MRQKGKKCLAGNTRNLMGGCTRLSVNLLGPTGVREWLRNRRADLEVSCIRAGRILGNDVCLENREQELCRYGKRSHSVARGQ